MVSPYGILRRISQTNFWKSVPRMHLGAMEQLTIVPVKFLEGEFLVKLDQKNLDGDWKKRGQEDARDQNG